MYRLDRWAMLTMLGMVGTICMYECAYGVCVKKKERAREINNNVRMSQLYYIVVVSMA
jgi:hypothetical protein